MARLMDIGGSMKITHREVRLNEDFQPVMVLTIEFPLSLEHDPQSCDDGAFYGRVLGAIYQFDQLQAKKAGKADECS
jgi:hypothetical protein